MSRQNSAQAGRPADNRQEARHVLFLSHAGVDADAALRLADQIEATPAAREHGLKVWVGKRDLEAGHDWQQQLERAIEEQSTAFAVYLGATGIINWVDSEARLALSRAHRDTSYRFVPIISAGASGSSALPGFARQYQGVRNVENRPEELAKLIRAALGETAEHPVQLVEQPFPGLRAFDEDQAHLFFGRESETEELVEKLRREPLLMVVGDSGSGKSSLVRAGLVPRFRGGALADQSRDQPDDAIWHVVIARPRGRSFEALADAVFQSGEAAGIDIAKLGSCKDWIRTRAPEKVRDGLIHGAPKDARILLVVDQFEELLIQAEEASRQAYIDALLGMVADPSDRSVRIVMTMRYDYHNLCSQFPAFFERLGGKHGGAKYSLERMKREGLRACVQEPLRLVGRHDYTETLANEVVRDIGERPGNMALMQMALREVWQKRRQFNDDLLEAYVSVGRVTGALPSAANEVLENRLDDQERQLAEIAFIRLVRLGDTGGTTRRTATRDEFSDDVWAVVQKLATEDCRRLLFIGGEPGHESAELAHEAVATQWPRYQTWLQQAADDKRRLDRLIDRVERWTRTGKGDEDLATGTDREEFRALAQSRPSWLASAERKFVDDSVQAQRRVEARERKLRNQIQRGDSLYRAEQARNMLAQGLPVTGMQLALAGLSEAPMEPDARCWIGETAGALVEAMSAQRERLVLRGHGRSVHAAAFSPDAARIVSGSADWTLRIWDAADGEELMVLRGHEDEVFAAAFSPDGGRIITGSKDGTARMWDTASGAELMVLSGHESHVWVAAFSPDGRRIVTGCWDDTARVWDATSGAELRVLGDHKLHVAAAEFSPDCARIVSGSMDGTARVWDATSGAELTVLRGHESYVWAAAFSPDGARVASGSEDKTVRVWDAANGAELLVLRGHEGCVWAAAFSPDGTRIVSGSSDRTARVWDAARGAELLVLRGHERAVQAAAFSPDGARIVSGSWDGTVRVWDPASGVLLRHEDSVDAAAFSPDGARIVSGSWDGTVRVWDAASGAELFVLCGHEDSVNAAAFSPNGARIVSGSSDGTVRVWDVASMTELLALRLRDHGGLVDQMGSVYAVAFSPDGARIVSGSRDGAVDGTVRVWDAANGAELFVLRGHEDKVLAVTLSRDGGCIVSGSSDATVRVWDAASMTELLVLRGHESGIGAVAFSPDDARIVSGSFDLTVRVWEAASGAELFVLRGHEDGVVAVAFSLDGARIVSGSWDGTVRVWDAASGAELFVLRGHEGSVNAAAFSPDGARIVSGSDDKTVRVTWIGRNKQELIETARARLPRELTEEERRRFHLAVE